MPEPVPYGVYISGPMQGVPEYNYPLFNWVEAEIHEGFPTPKPAKGTVFTVYPINPARNFEGRTDLSREVYLECALRQVDEAKAIVMLPDWHQSPGARLELARALRNGIDVYYWHGHDVAGGEFVHASESAMQEILDKTAQPVPAAIEPGKELIEQEASRLVRGGERQKNYGHPRGDFDTIARYWSNHLGIEVTAQDVAIMMLLLKVARLKSNPDHHDSRVDGIGYLICLDRLDEPYLEDMDSINEERVRRGMEPFREVAA